jgi:hypothetical protein
VGVPEPGRCGHAAAWLPGARNLRGAACAGAVEGAARGCGSTASGKLCLAPALEARAGWSAILPRPESSSSSAVGTRGWSRRCGVGGQEPSRAHRNARHTIEARRRAESVDNNNDNRSRHNNDRGRKRFHDSNDDRARSWSPNQRGPQAFGRSIRDAKFPRASGLRPTYQDTMGTPTPVYGSSTTGSRATPVGRPTIFS